MDFLSVGLGVVQGASSIIGGFNAAADQAGQIAYSNAMNKYKTNIINKYRKEAYKRRVENVKEQYELNFSAANTAWQQEQSRFIEQMLGFSFRKDDMLKSLVQAEGFANATEQQGVSQQRAKLLMNAGAFGQRNARFVESIKSASKQHDRNMNKTSNQLLQTDMNAFGTIQEAPFLEMASKQQMPSFNAALTIGQGLLGGFQTAGQMDPLFDFSSNDTTTN